jgi:hypothetical protein
MSCDPAWALGTIIAVAIIFGVGGWLGGTLYLKEEAEYAGSLYCGNCGTEVAVATAETVFEDGPAVRDLPVWKPGRGEKPWKP